jgi:hypothetical protein
LRVDNDPLYEPETHCEINCTIMLT